ncbi:MAG: energy-coupling factor ABC transporter ATP-binding protein [Methanomicrobiales archaeon]|nr:energy-coupling factor ABC transporter ATP-binding protein [Methanomicrobiales archaeon]
MIEITALKHRILDIPHLTIPTGLTALIGPNGSGKSTLLRLCAGIESPLQGTVTIDRESPRHVDVGWVDEFPDRTLLFDRVSDELSSALSFRHTPCTTIIQEVTSIARECGIAHLLPRRCRELSGGEKVLVALGSALASRPQVLILDEFDSHLDFVAAERIREYYRTMSLSTVLFCTQDMEAASGADHILFLDSGKVNLEGPPADVFKCLEGTCFYPLRWRVAQCR